MTRSERICIGYLGVLYFEAGELDRAEDHLRRAAFASRQSGDFRVEGIFEGIRGAVLATLDCTEKARMSFDLAEQLLAGNSFYAGSIAVYRGHLDLAEARARVHQRRGREGPHRARVQTNPGRVFFGGSVGRALGRRPRGSEDPEARSSTRIGST
jgi:hypothetical protein